MKKAFLKNFGTFTGKIPVLASLFNKFAGLQAFNFMKKRHSSTGVFLWILRNFKNTYFEEQLRTLTSEGEVLIFYWWDFEDLLLRYNGIFSIFFQLIFCYDSFVRVWIMLLRNLYIYAINITDIIDIWDRF